MKIFKSSNQNLDELVFENRNKVYGAYAIRASYDNNLKKGFFITFFIPLILILFSVIYNQLHGNSLPPNPADFLKSNDSLLVVEVLLDKIEPTPPKNNTQSAKTVNTNYVVSNIIDEVDTINERPEIPYLGNKGSTDVSGKLTDGGSGGFTVGVPKADDEVLLDVEKMPEFNGDLYDYFANEIKYPKAALENNIQGKVMISFVIDANGKVGQVELLNNIGFGCDEEAMRVIKNMPQWSAGEQNQRKVSVRMILPIVFEVNN